MADPSIDSLPADVTEIITRHLSQHSRHRLCDAVHSFGQQPTSDLITALNIPLLALTRPLLSYRMSCVTTMTVSGYTTTCPSSDTDSDDSAEGTATAVSLVTFLLHNLPACTHLTSLHLHGVPLAWVVVAMDCLPVACPALACVTLRDLSLDDSPVCSDDSEDSGDLSDVVFTLQHLWQELAAIPGLQTFELNRSEEPEDLWLSYDQRLQGIGAVTQLRSLSLCRANMRLSDLSQLVALTKLKLELIKNSNPPEGSPAPDLGALTALRHLVVELEVDKEEDDEDDLGVSTFLPAFAACPGLASLEVNVPAGSFPFAWVAPLAHFAALGRLSAEWREFFCDLLCTLPALRELRCHTVVLPSAGADGTAGVTVPHLRVLHVGCLRLPYKDVQVGDTYQPLAQTFPSLTALHWADGASPDHEDLHERLGELLPPTPAGGFPHLRRLSAPASTVHLLLGAHPHPHAVWDLVVLPTHEDCRPGVQDRKGYARWPAEWLADLRLAMGHASPLLRRVELRGDEVGDKSLTALARRWPDVEEVTLRGAENVTDKGLRALARLPRLRRVALVRCPAVTAGAVAALAARWSVEVIEVCGCDLVGEADVWPLISRPQLDIVHSLVEAEAAPWWGGAGEDVAA